MKLQRFRSSLAAAQWSGKLWFAVAAMMAFSNLFLVWHTLMNTAPGTACRNGVPCYAFPAPEETGKLIYNSSDSLLPASKVVVGSSEEGQRRTTNNENITSHCINRSIYL